MEMKEYTDVEVNLKELLAAIVHGGRKILAVALIFAVLLGAVGALNHYVLEEDPEGAYQAALEEYELAKDELELALERAERDEANQREYNEKSQLLQIDPYNKITTTIVFAISGIDPESVTDSFGVTEIPASYITSRIQAQYMALWNGLDLEKIVSGGVADKYLREVITLTATDGGVLTLAVSGSDAAACEQIAQSVYAAIAQSKEAVVNGSYDHQLTLLSDAVTKSAIDWTLEQIRLDNKAKLEKYQENVEKCEKELAQLSAPSRDGGIKEIAVNAVIGAVIGVVLGIIWLVIDSFVKGCVSGSKQLSARYSLLHLGSLMKKTGFWAMRSYRVMGEKLWKNEEQACSYIRENGLSHLPEGGSLVIASTLEEVSEEVQKELSELLSAKGQKVTFVTDAAHCPQALAAISQCDGIVLAERAFASRNMAVKDVLKTAETLDKPIYGFVLL